LSNGISDDGYTIDEIGRLWLDSQEARVDRGELSRGTFIPMVTARDFVVDHLPPNRPAASITPAKFSELRRKVKTETERNLRSQKNLIVDIRSMFRWAVKSGYLPSVDFGPEFVAPSANAIAREQEQAGNSRFIDRKIILSMLMERKQAVSKGYQRSLDEEKQPLVLRLQEPYWR
jgi:hypothetical protein